MFSTAENDGLNEWVYSSSEVGSLDTPPWSPGSSYSALSSPPSSASSTQWLSPLSSWSPLSEETEYDSDAFKLRPAFDSPDSLSRRPLPALNVVDDDFGRGGRRGAARRQRIRHKDPYPLRSISPKSQAAPHCDQFDPSQFFVKSEPIGYSPFHYRYPSLSPERKVEPLGLGLDLAPYDAGVSSDEEDGAASSVDLEARELSVSDPGSSPSPEADIAAIEQESAALNGSDIDSAGEDDVVARARGRVQGRKSFCLSPSTPPPVEVECPGIPANARHPFCNFVLPTDWQPCFKTSDGGFELDVDMLSVPAGDEALSSSDDDSRTVDPPESLTLANFFDFDLASQDPAPSSETETSPPPVALAPAGQALDVLSLDFKPGLAGFNSICRGDGDWYPSLPILTELSFPWSEISPETESFCLDPRVLSDSDSDGEPGPSSDDPSAHRKVQRRSRRKDPYRSSSPRLRASSTPTSDSSDLSDSSPCNSPGPSLALPPAAFGGDATGDFLRQKLGLPTGAPVNLWVLPDRYDPEDKKVTLQLIASIAIYSSEEKQLELCELREAFKARFSFFRDEANSKWPVKFSPSYALTPRVFLQECFSKRKDLLTMKSVWTYDHTKDGLLSRERKRRATK
ncbi:hypothetical protein FB45DRAFT_1024875 [Roridomyces roridus]|uniref:Fork-head domain-containing protein n=1 Tax=Roridomyces roridus TaxID=1738132 RepID=A0AAD7C232_9AGAR|nr:hypothetical protein FB45DRAFT_1024875 [Roridomyces roridus]